MLGNHQKGRSGLGMVKTGGFSFRNKMGGREKELGGEHPKRRSSLKNQMISGKVKRRG